MTCHRSATSWRPPSPSLVALPPSRRPPPRPQRRPRRRRLRVLLFYKANFHASHVQARAGGAATSPPSSATAVRPDGRHPGDRGRRGVHAPRTWRPRTRSSSRRPAACSSTPTQRAALEAYIRGGGGFMGMHYTGWSVGQSEHDVNPFYRRLVGAVSEGHPENPGVRPAPSSSTDAAQPADAGLAGEPHPQRRVVRLDVNPAPDVHTLVDGRRVAPTGMGRQGTHAPGHLVPADRQRPVLVHRHGPRGHGVLRAVHARPDAQRPRLRGGPAAGRLLAARQGRARRAGAASRRGRWCRSTWR